MGKRSNFQIDLIRRVRQLTAAEFWRPDSQDVRMRLRMTLDDLEADPNGPNPLVIELRQIDYTDHEGNLKRIWVLASEPFDIPDESPVVFWNTAQILTCPAGQVGPPVMVEAGLFERESQAAADARAVAYGQTLLVCTPIEAWTEGAWELFDGGWQLIGYQDEETFSATGTWDLQGDLV